MSQKAQNTSDYS